ncbi:Trophinin [Penaeus vannamei]|uniref:Trophinin n=1 Tax=Penaeus vannamei TaxID=6689 RepID=A0A3R7Q4F2_PENVA|nr:Trophinin [Penaeus vannamei]
MSLTDEHVMSLSQTNTVMSLADRPRDVSRNEHRSRPHLRPKVDSSRAAASVPPAPPLLPPPFRVHPATSRENRCSAENRTREGENVASPRRENVSMIRDFGGAHVQSPPDFEEHVQSPLDFGEACSVTHSSVLGSMFSHHSNFGASMFIHPPSTLRIEEHVPDQPSDFGGACSVTHRLWGACSTHPSTFGEGMFNHPRLWGSMSITLRTCWGRHGINHPSLWGGACTITLRLLGGGIVQSPLSTLGEMFQSTHSLWGSMFNFTTDFGGACSITPRLWGSMFNHPSTTWAEHVQSPLRTFWGAVLLPPFDFGEHVQSPSTSGGGMFNHPRPLGERVHITPRLWGTCQITPSTLGSPVQHPSTFGGAMSVTPRLWGACSTHPRTFGGGMFNAPFDLWGTWFK